MIATLDSFVEPRGIDFAALQTAYHQFCKNEEVPVPAVDLAEVIDFYNKAVADLPDHTRLKDTPAVTPRLRPER